MTIKYFFGVSAEVVSHMAETTIYIAGYRVPTAYQPLHGPRASSVILPGIDPSVYEVELEGQIDSSSSNHSEN